MSHFHNLIWELRHFPHFLRSRVTLDETENKTVTNPFSSLNRRKKKQKKKAHALFTEPTTMMNCVSLHETAIQRESVCFVLISPLSPQKQWVSGRPGSDLTSPTFLSFVSCDTNGCRWCTGREKGHINLMITDSWMRQKSLDKSPAENETFSNLVFMFEVVACGLVTDTLLELLDFLISLYCQVFLLFCPLACNSCRDECRAAQ